MHRHTSEPWIRCPWMTCATQSMTCNGQYESMNFLWQLIVVNVSASLGGPYRQLKNWQLVAACMCCCHQDAAARTTAAAHLPTKFIP